MVKYRSFQKSYAKELIKISELDLEAADALITNGVKRPENIFFFLQQVIEKALKAYLCYLEIPVPMTHHIDFILDKIPDAAHVPSHEELSELSEFASIRRYEEGAFEFSPEEIAKVRNTTAKVLEFCQSKIHFP